MTDALVEIPKPKVIKPPASKMPETAYKTGFNEEAFREANNFMDWLIDTHENRFTFQQPMPNETRKKIDQLWDIYLPVFKTSIDSPHVQDTVKKMFRLMNIDTAFGKTSQETLEFICSDILRGLGSAASEEIIEAAGDAGRLDFLQAAMSSRLKDNPELNSQIRSRFLNILHGYGLDGETILKSWLKTGEPGKRRLLENMHAVTALEKNKPGITQFLYEQFNIRNFGRYPTDTLIDQYEQVNDKSSPYGVLLYPLADWNHAFFDDIGPIHYLYLQLKELGYALRIMECENKLDLVHSLNSSRKRFGPIQFAIIGGHGNKDSIEFGDGKNEALSTEDFSLKGARATSMAFAENPTVVLISCSVGKKGGIAQQVSSLGGEVIAADQNTGLNHIAVALDKNRRLTFDVAYQDEVAVRYAEGKQTKRKATLS